MRNRDKSGSGGGYIAFLSYSHEDEADATWLHRALESYRVPKELVGVQTELGTVPARLTPIFRDREEFAAASSLPRAINQALEQSRFLVVVCTPRSAASRWVNEEILQFKRLGRETRILALIADGVPGAARAGSPVELECFPPALAQRIGSDGEPTSAGLEPLAADLRPTGDGPENAKLKLVAALLGVGLDDLKRRELHAARARARRASAIAAVMGILAVLAIIGGVLAYFKSVEATQERNAALSSQSLFLADQSFQQASDGRIDLAVKLALEALPRDLAAPERPYVGTAEMALYAAVGRRRFDRVLVPGRDGLETVLVSPDGTRAITVHAGESALLWDLTTGEVLRSYQDAVDFIDDVTFSPRGRLFAVAYKQTARTSDYDGVRVPATLEVIDAATGDTRDKFGLLGWRHSFVRFVPESELVFASDRYQGALLNPGSPKIPVWISGFAARAVSADFERTGALMAVVTKDGSGVILSVDGEGTPRELPLGAFGLVSLEFAPDGRTILTRSNAGRLFLFDSTNGQLLTEGHIESPDEVVAAHFSATGDAVLGITRNGALVIAGDGGRAPLESAGLSAGKTVGRAVFAPDGGSVLVGFEGGGVEWWNLESRRRKVVPTLESRTLMDADYTTDGKRMLIATDDNWARLWSPHRDASHPRLTGRVTGASASALEPAGEQVVIGYDDGALEVWDWRLAKRRWRNERAHNKAVRSVDFHPDGKILASGAEDGLARIWRGATGELVETLRGHSESVDFVSFEKGGELLLTAGRDATARLWDGGDGELKQVFAVPSNFLDPIESFNFNHHGALTADGRHLVTVSAGDGEMVFQPALVWDVESTTVKHPLRHEGSIYHVSVANEGRSVLTASYDGQAVLWDLMTGRRVREFTGHDSAVTAGIVFANGRLLVTSSADGTARLWDVESGLTVEIMRHETGGIRTLALSGDERLLATAGTDGRIRLWDAHTGQFLYVLATGDSKVREISFGPDGLRLLCRLNDGRVESWQLPPRGQGLIDHAWERVRREGASALTRQQRIRFFMEAP